MIFLGMCLSAMWMIISVICYRQVISLSVRVMGNRIHDYSSRIIKLIWFSVMAVTASLSSLSSLVIVYFKMNPPAPTFMQYSLITENILNLLFGLALIIIFKLYEKS